MSFHSLKIIYSFQWLFHHCCLYFLSSFSDSSDHAVSSSSFFGSSSFHRCHLPILFFDLSLRFYILILPLLDEVTLFLFFNNAAFISIFQLWYNIIVLLWWKIVVCFEKSILSIFFTWHGIACEDTCLVLLRSSWYRKTVLSKIIYLQILKANAFSVFRNNHLKRNFGGSLQQQYHHCVCVGLLVFSNHVIKYNQFLIWYIKMKNVFMYYWVV